MGGLIDRQAIVTGARCNRLDDAHRRRSHQSDCAVVVGDKELAGLVIYDLGGGGRAGVELVDNPSGARVERQDAATRRVTTIDEIALLIHGERVRHGAGCRRRHDLAAQGIKHDHLL